MKPEDALSGNTFYLLCSYGILSVLSIALTHILGDLRCRIILSRKPMLLRKREHRVPLADLVEPLCKFDLLKVYYYCAYFWRRKRKARR